MPTNNPIDSFSKQEIRKILIAGLLLIAFCTGYYLYLRHGIRRDAEKRAQHTLKQTERLIRARMGRTEANVNAIRLLAEHTLDNPDEMYSIASYVVESTMPVTSAGVAFIENYYPEKGRWFLAYAGYPDDSDTLVIKQLGGKNHDYLSMEWFQKGLESEDGCWSSPYFVRDGGQAAMMTYARAIQDPSGRKVGVIGADITLDTLADIVDNMQIFPHSYCTIVSESTGEVIVGPPAKDKRRGHCHTYTKHIDGKNMILTLTITNADMYKRLHKDSLAFFLLAMGCFISIFLIAYSSVQNIWRLGEERLKNQHIEDELAIARDIQMSLVPSKVSGLADSLNISGILKPAKFVGGDLYDYYVRDNKLIFCIGDIAGKGVPAAMLMSIAHSLFRTLSAHSDQPERIMRELNRSMSDNNPDIMFITMFLGVLDLKTGTVTYCNAGHNPPILIQSGKAKYMDNADNLLLGVEMEAEYTSKNFILNNGDTLFLYTDGLTEAENSQKVLFGEQNALDVANKFGKMTADEQINNMCAAVKHFVGPADQSDDITMLAIRFQGRTSTLVLNNNIQELDKLEPFLAKFFEKENLDMSLLPQFDLALEEAATNVIMYAYPEGEKGTAELTLELKNGQIHSVLSDSGSPFDPLQSPAVNLDVSLEERKIGGLGIHLIKEIMKDVSYEHKNGKNVLSMRFDV